MRRFTPPRVTAMRAMATIPAMAGALMLAACASTPGSEQPAQPQPSEDLAWQTQTPDTSATSAETTRSSTEFWDAVKRVETTGADIIARNLGEDFHAMLGKQDTGVALATLATDILGWDLDAGFTPSASVSADEAVIAAGLEDPASIGEDSADTIRAKAFVRAGVDDAEDFAGAMCRTLTEGTRATFVAAVADAADASRSDAASPTLAGAGLITVICPAMTDEYLTALRELASMRA